MLEVGNAMLMEMCVEWPQNRNGEKYHFLIHFLLQEILKSVRNFKKWLKYDVTMKIYIIEDITEMIYLGNYSILKLFIWQEKLQLNSNTMGVNCHAWKAMPSSQVLGVFFC